MKDRRWLIFAALVAVFVVLVTRISPIVLMASAIKQFEGWFAPGAPGFPEGSVSFRNNNPGNLKYAGQPGATGMDSQGHAIFDSYNTGWLALVRQLEAAFSGTSTIYYPQMTLLDFFSRWQTADPVPYAEFVALKLGVTSGTRLAELA